MSMNLRRHLLLPLITIRRRIERNVLTKLALLTAVCIVLGSMVYHASEQGSGRSFVESLEDVLILLISGFEMDKPDSTVAVVSAFCILVFGVIFVTLLTAEIAAGAVEKRLKKGHGTGRVKWQEHIIVCGWDPRVDQLVPQLRSKDAERQWQVVIVTDRVEANPYDDEDVEFVHGDPARDEVLKRAAVEAAKAVIVLGDTQSDTTGAQDAHAILTALAVKYLAPHVYTCVELADPENEKHLRHAKVDEIICPSLFGTCMLVQATLNPGLPRLLRDILTFDEGMEVYKCPISPQTAGRTYGEFATRLLMQHELTAMAIERGDEMLVNPSPSTIIEDGDWVFVLALAHPGIITEMAWDSEESE